MIALAGPFAAVTIVLAAGAALKVARPAPTARALSAMGLPARAWMVRVVALAELAAAGAALVAEHRAFAAVISLSYLSFAAFVAAALRRHLPISSCGCFGAVDTPPTKAHVALNLASAVAAGAVALDPGWTMPSVLAGQPLAGVPFLLLTAVAAWFSYLALTLLPRTAMIARRSS